MGKASQAKEGMKIVSSVNSQKSEGRVLQAKNIILSRTADWEYFGKTKLPIKKFWFAAQEWMGILRMEDFIYRDVVRKFYSRQEDANEEGFTIILNKLKYIIDMKCISQVFAIPNEGARIVNKKDIKDAKGYNEAKLKKEAVADPHSVENQSNICKNKN